MNKVDQADKKDFDKIAPDDVTATDLELKNEYDHHGIRGVFRLGVVKKQRRAVTLGQIVGYVRISVLMMKTN